MNEPIHNFSLNSQTLEEWLRSSSGPGPALPFLGPSTDLLCCTLSPLSRLAPPPEHPQGQMVQGLVDRAQLSTEGR